jgi:DNA-binding XRE family transcriptional regulator
MERSTKSVANPQAFAIHALALWKDAGKLQKDLADVLGVEPETLSHWKAGRVRPGLETAARTIYHLHLAKCFGDATEALDLAWLMGLTAEAVEEQLTAALQVDASLVHFFQWLQAGDKGKGGAKLPLYLPSLPAYHVPTDLACQVRDALLASREYRTPLYQVVVLHGGPGVGKTTTTAAILRDEMLRRYFQDGVLFLPLAGKEDSEQVLWRACEQAGLAVEHAEKPDELLRLFRQWVGQDSRLALLVLDDPQQAEDLLPLLDVGPQVRLLVTCQDRRTVARALEECWEPASELVLWQAVSGLAAEEGLALVQHWLPDDLPPDEEQARQRAGELIGWHPLALRLCAAEARDTNWQHVEALVLEGNLDPDDFSELAGWFRKSWERLSPADQQALASLQRAFQQASTFGPGIAAAVWEQNAVQAQVRISRLEDRALIERVAGEPWPWQDWIQRAFGGQERYRLMPLLRLINIQPDEQPAKPSRFRSEEIRWLLAVDRRFKTSPFGPAQVPFRFALANFLIGIPLWYFDQDTPKLEERLLDLWNRQGLPPPRPRCGWLSKRPAGDTNPSATQPSSFSPSSAPSLPPRLFTLGSRAR